MQTFFQPKKAQTQDTAAFNMLIKTKQQQAACVCNVIKGTSVYFYDMSMCPALCPPEKIIALHLPHTWPVIPLLPLSCQQSPSSSQVVWAQALWTMECCPLSPGPPGWAQTHWCSITHQWTWRQCPLVPSWLAHLTWWCLCLVPLWSSWGTRIIVPPSAWEGIPTTGSGAA